MLRALRLSLALGCAGAAALAGFPENIQVVDVPPVSPEAEARVAPYLEYRTAAFQGWHPVRREALLITRFSETAQLHSVRAPLGARRQLTFGAEPILGGGYRPRTGEMIVYSQDVGGGEFYQLFRLDAATGAVTLLTDGKSRNSAPRWAPSGKEFAFSSTRRNGRDTDIYVMSPDDPASSRLVFEARGGGWSALDWSPDESKLLVQQYISINESQLYLGDLSSGKLTRIDPAEGGKASFSGGRFLPDGNSIHVLSDLGSEHMRLCRVDLGAAKLTPLAPEAAWDVEEFEVSPHGDRIAVSVNEDGSSRLKVVDAQTGRQLPLPELPKGLVGGLQWHPATGELGFTFSSARAPAEVYSIDLATSAVTRWTESETGGLDPAKFPEPELVRIPSFDGLPISGFLYRPDPARFPGGRPLVINIHGGPEGQSKAGFLAHNNYLPCELGVALFFPNVRGSAGYGKTFLALDNGFKREDAVRDIGAFLEWFRQNSAFDAGRVAVMGGSYGGYMSLASLVHYSDKLRCGVDLVGISNFVTFLQNTQDYRRDLRRVEYGDERDPAMREFLGKISPANQPGKITVPLYVLQGANDPRVPASESEQMVEAIRSRGGKVWYFLAKDEGHGFKKKRTRDLSFQTTIQFFEENLLK